MVKLSQQEFEKKYGKSSYNALSNIQPSNELNSYSLSETFGDIKQTGSNLINTVKETFAKSQEAKTASRRGEQGMVRGFAQQAGIGLGGISQVGGDLFTGAVKTALPQAGEDVLKAGVSSTVKPLTESNFVKSIYEKYNSLDETKKRDIDATLGLGSFLTDLVGFGLAKKPVVSALKAGSEAVTTGIKAAEEITTRIPRATEKLITMTKEGITPVISKEKAIGEVLQGTTQDIKKGTAGLSLVDTKGIKTYQKLNEAIDKKIPELAKVVDNEFAQDTTKKLLNDLTITKPTKAGGTVSVNYVDNALNQLAELYTKTGDVVKQADIEDLINIAKTDGLNKLEINDIARNYGQEFGDKAFNKMGDPLTSINAQMFENTRKGVKEVARSGLTSNVAKKADEAMSKLYDTRALVKKNVEAVNKLMNRIEERGLVEKIGYNVSKYADILTGGSLRGFIGGILPRGAGYKTLNALDLEALLERNLKIINEATKAKTPSQFKEITSQLLDRNSSVKNTLTNEAKNINQVTKTGANINNANKTNSIIQDTIPQKKINKQSGFISTGGDNKLYQEAKKFKTAEEFVKSKLDENSFVNKEPITVYRGEGEGIGNNTLVNGKYFADSEKFASNFGNVTKSEIPAGAKIFDLDKVKKGNNIISDEALVDPEKLTNFLKDNGYEYTKNTNTRGTEYVKLARFSRSSKLYTDYEVFNKTNRAYKDLVNQYSTFDAFQKSATKRAKELFDKTGETFDTSTSGLKEYWNRIKKNDIPKLDIPKEKKLEQIWKEANLKASTKQGMTAVNPLTVGAGVTALGAGVVSLKNKK